MMPFCRFQLGMMYIGALLLPPNTRAWLKAQLLRLLWKVAIVTFDWKPAITGFTISLSCAKVLGFVSALL